VIELVIWTIFVIILILMVNYPWSYWVRAEPPARKNCLACGRPIAPDENFWKYGDEQYHDSCVRRF